MQKGGESPEISISAEKNADRYGGALSPGSKPPDKGSSVVLDILSQTPSTESISDGTSTPLRYQRPEKSSKRRCGLTLCRYMKKALLLPFRPHSLVGYFIRLLLITCLLMLPGVMLHLLHPELAPQGIQLLHWFAYAAYLILGYYYLHFICRFSLYMVRKEYFSVGGTQLSHKFYVIKRPLSFTFYIIGWIIIWNSTPLGFLSIWKKQKGIVNDVFIVTIVATIIYAYKQYVIQNISVKFNYTNYLQRVQDCLFVDRVLTELIDKGPELFEKNRTIHSHSKDKYGFCVFEQGDDDYISNEGARDSRTASQTIPALSVTSFQSESSAQESSKKFALKLDTFTQKEKEELELLSSSSKRQKTVTRVGEKEHLDPFALAHSLKLFRKLEKRIRDRFSTDSEDPEAYNSSMIDEFAFVMGDLIVRWLATEDNVFLPPGYLHIEKDKKSQKKAAYKLPPGVKPMIRLGKSDFSKIVSDPSDIDRLWKMLTALKKSKPKTGDQDANDSVGKNGSNLPQEISYDHITIRSRHISEFVSRYIAEIILTSKGLRSMEYVIEKLDVLFIIALTFVFFIIVSQIFTSAASIIAAVITAITGMSFMLSSSARNVFESATYVFAIHPYDIGDRVYLSLTPTAGPTGAIVLPAGGTLLTAAPGSGTLDNLLVTHVELLSTTFERWDGAKVIVPNYILATKPLINIRRSGALFETHRLQLGFETDHELFDKLKEDIRGYLALSSKEYHSEYLLMTFDCIENVNRLQLTVTLKHRTNWQDWEEQITRRSKFVLFLKERLSSLGISYSLPMQPIDMLPPYQQK